MRVPGQIERFENFHDLPVILFQGLSTGLGSNSTPSAPVERPPMTDRHAAKPDSPGRSAVRTQGDAVSAYRDIGLSAVTDLPALSNPRDRAA